MGEEAPRSAPQSWWTRVAKIVPADAPSGEAGRTYMRADSSSSYLRGSRAAGDSQTPPSAGSKGSGALLVGRTFS